MSQLFSLRPHDEVTAADTRESAAELRVNSTSASSARLDEALTGPLSIVARRRLGDSQLTVFPIALGGSVFGWTADTESSTEILDRYSDHGGNVIDTADSYVGGHSEVIIGGWLRKRRNRDHMLVMTKIGRNPDNPGLGSVNMVRAVEASLERLQTDRIDVLTFHDDDPSVPLEDSLATVEWLIETGKVRYLAASNFSAERLIEARILSSTGLPQFLAIQVRYNLMSRELFEGDLCVVAEAQSLGVMPHTALAGGFLTGKYRSKTDASGDSARAANALGYVGRKGHRVLGALDRVAAAHETSVTAISLAWLLAKRNIAAPVASATDPGQVDAIMEAAGIRLTRAQMLELDRVSE